MCCFTCTCIDRLHQHLFCLCIWVKDETSRWISTVYIGGATLMYTVQPKTYARARTSFCVGWLRVTWAWVLETARSSLRLHDKSARTSLRFFAWHWEERDRVRVIESARWSERHSRVSAKSMQTEFKMQTDKKNCFFCVRNEITFYSINYLLSRNNHTISFPINNTITLSLFFRNVILPHGSVLIYF